MKRNQNNGRLSSAFLNWILVFCMILITIGVLTGSFWIFNSQYRINKNSSVNAANSGPKNTYWVHYRLPEFIKPQYYDIQLFLPTSNINPMRMEEPKNKISPFYGRSKLYFKVTKSIKFIVLHHHDIKIKSKTLFQLKNNTSLYDISSIISKTIYYSFYNYWIIVLGKSIPKDTLYMLDITYEGSIKRVGTGVIKTFYNDVKTQKTYKMLYSKLEPVGARTLLPCFDEPNLKIKFQMQIFHEPHMLCSSNMPESSVIANASLTPVFPNIKFDDSITNNLTLTKFQPTEIPMSTYLIAFVIAEQYTYSQIERKPNQPVRIYYPEFSQYPVKYALKFAKAAENEMEKYFNLTSPLPKSDHIYIPNFLSGAMENWGLMSYREDYLLVEDIIALRRSRSKLDTLSHELVHIWFGNWVTNGWWSEIWLNEGFATYFSTFIYNRLSHTSDFLKEAHNVYTTRRMLAIDKEFIPIIIRVEHPYEFSTMFNSQVYSKGRALIAWIQSIMGEVTFHKAIVDYLNTFKTRNPTSIQFLETMDKHYDQLTKRTVPNIKNMFYKWLTDYYYPTITVKLVKHTKSIEITQSFNKFPIHSKFLIGKDLNIEKSVYFEKAAVVNLDQETDIVLFNSDGKGYFRTKYSNESFDRIVRELRENKTTRISSISKSVIFDDYISFMINNQTNPVNVAKLLTTLKDDKDVISWTIFYHRIHYKFNSIHLSDSEYIHWKNAIKRLSKTVTQTIIAGSFENVNNIEQVFQLRILKMSLELQDEKILNWISKEFKRWIVSPRNVKLPRHLMGLILHYGIKDNDKYEYWIKIWKLLMKEGDQDPYLALQYKIGLIGTQKSHLAQQVLNLYLKVKTHISITAKVDEFLSLTRWLKDNFRGRQILVDWVKINYRKLKQFVFPSSKLSQADYFFNSFCKFYENEEKMVAFDSMHRYICMQQIRRNELWKRNIGDRLIYAIRKLEI